VTAQIANRIHVGSKEHLLFADAMRGFFDRHGRPPFVARTTANWCGYRTEWRLTGERLYLVALVGTICRRQPDDGAEPTAACKIGHYGDCDRHSICLADICGAGPMCVFADWVSEDLRIASGEVLRYVHAGWGSRYEREECLCVRAGVLIDRFDLAPEADEQETQQLSVWRRFRSALMPLFATIRRYPGSVRSRYGHQISSLVPGFVR
jgi:hypothetical protein